ncbi:hypothetical protein, conserved [Eimeria brunetti]|uniref:PARP catalytic domain-containing protein n=1 Tax=Eimeria brunetti TaxID=51314 RepID=U6LPW3_9EIME|nr:hypothetical protein, conserved [Eimeria brunetti]
MGASQSKKQVGRFGLRGSRITSLHERRSWLLATTEPSNHCDYPHRKSCRRYSNRQRERRRRLQRAWLCYKGRLPPPAPSDGQVGSSVPTPWLDMPQGGSVGYLRERPAAQAQSASSGNVAEADGSGTGCGDVDCSRNHEEFRARPWQVSAYVQKGGPLCLAYANCLEYMEEDVIAALIHHPLPNEGLALIYRSCCTVPLPVEPTLEPSADVLGYVFPGTFFKVLDLRAHIAQTSYLLRLKTAEGWLTGASLHMIRLSQPARVSALRAAHEEVGSSRFRHRVSGFVKVSAAVANRQQAWDPTLGQSRTRSSSAPDNIRIAVDGDGEKDGLVELEDALSTTWGTVYACRATRFLSFQECARLAEERTSYNSLGKLITTASMHKLEAAVHDATKSQFSNAGSLRVEPTPCLNRLQSINSDSSRIVTRSSIRVGGLSPLEHSFLLFRVVGAHAVPVSATPHLGSPIVGRLLRGQVFPVLDACLVSCVQSCGSLQAVDDCMIAGLGTSGIGDNDKLHAVPLASLCDGLIERVDECEVTYDRPVLYEIVADGYLVNVRPALEIEGQVRRTLPPATLVEVYERKINAEGLVRLRLIDGWINERRKSSGETGFLFAARTVDRRAETFRRHLTAVGLLLPALCSSDHRVRTAAASWVAANATQSLIASSALMEAVDTDLVNSAMRPCTCCFCKGHQGDRDPLSAEYPPSICGTNSPRRSCLVSSKEAASRLNEPERSKRNILGCAGRMTVSGDSRQGITASSGVHSLKPLAAKDLLLAESPVVKSPSSIGSVWPTLAPRIDKDDRSNTFASGGSGGGLAHVPLPLRDNECSSGVCHRGRCFFEDVESILGTSGNNGGGSGNHEKPAGPWISLFSLLKAASALPGELASQPVRCSQCSNIQEVLLELLTGQSEHRESVPPCAVYRPPVGSFMCPSNNTSVSVGKSQQHALLESYRPYLVVKDGKLTLGNPNRFNSFSFHQPPIFVANLNEYFLFHGCTEERAGLIALSGFDFRRGGENGGKLFGIGTYFSPHASKADLYTRPNDLSAKATGPSPLSAVTFHISLPTLPFLPARTTQKPLVGAPPASAVLTSISSNMGTGGNSVGTASHSTSKTGGNLRFGKGGWLASGKASANAAHTASGSSPPVPTVGPLKKDKEKGRFRAVCAKLTRQSRRANTSRSKDSSASGQVVNSQKHSNSLPASLHQKIDITGGNVQPAGAKGPHPSAVSSAPQPITRCLLLARVCLGEVFKALSPMPEARMPPNKPNSTTAKLAYDSVMAECRTRGGVVDGVEFVVFERSQALPEFVITYSHAAHCQCAECHRQAPQ